MKFKLLLLIIISDTTVAFAQQQKRASHFPVGTFLEKNSTINGISVGLYSVLSQDSINNVHTNGIRLEAIGLGILSPLMPRSPIAETEEQFKAKMAEPLAERINGFNLSPAGTVCDCVVNGISAGLIGQINRRVSGVSVSVMINLAQEHNGIQVAMINESYAMRGFQIGFNNTSGKARGIQIGIFNHATNLKGIQFGLWNTNQKRKLPILNWNFGD